MPVETPPTLLEDIETAASAISSFVTAAALLVGAVWAYFKFIKDRVYRPRLDLSIDPIAYTDPTGDYLVCRLTAKNIGTSKVELHQEGSALTLMRGERGGESYDPPIWSGRRSYEVFAGHQWIESGETVLYDVAVSVPAPRGDALMLKLRLLCTQRKKRIETNTRVVLPPGTPAREVTEDGAE